MSVLTSGRGNSLAFSWEGFYVFMATNGENLFEFLGNTIVFAATGGSFDAVQKFVVNTEPDAELPIAGMGRSFETLRDQVGVEQAAGETKLCRQKLLRFSLDEPILEELGGLEKVQILLQTIYNFLKTADKSKLHTFYAYGLVVSANWLGRAWDLDALSIENPFGQEADSVVVSLEVVS